MAQLQDEPAATNGRTEKQRQAARVNGAKSRGPTTAAGKAHSRANAWKHGILARRIMPPTDFSGQSSLYRRIRVELMRELNPQTFTAAVGVDAFAHDYVQLMRCRQMMEAIHRVADLPQMQMKAWQVARQATIDRRLIQRALNAIDTGTDLKLPVKKAHKLAGLIVELVQQVEHDMQRYEAQQRATGGGADASAVTGSTESGEASQHDPDLPSGELDDEVFEDDEVQQLRHLHCLIQPMRRILQDRVRLAAFFSGNGMPARGELPRLRELMVEIAKAASHRSFSGRQHEEELKKQEQTRLLTLASDPRQLLLLSRYQRQLENAIERKLRRLQG
jgi:hypothetical protein